MSVKTGGDGVQVTGVHLVKDIDSGILEIEDARKRLAGLKGE